MSICLSTLVLRKSNGLWLSQGAISSHECLEMAPYLMSLLQPSQSSDAWVHKCMGAWKKWRKGAYFAFGLITIQQSWVNYFYCNGITNYFQVIVIDSNYQLLSCNCNWPQITNYSISSITISNNSITFKKNCLYLIVVCREITPHGVPPMG